MKDRVYSIGYVDSYGDFTKVWDKMGRTAKFTMEEARETAEMMKAKGRKNVRIYKGWTVVETI